MLCQCRIDFSSPIYCLSNFHFSFFVMSFFFTLSLPVQQIPDWMVSGVLLFPYLFIYLQITICPSFPRECLFFLHSFSKFHKLKIDLLLVFSHLFVELLQIHLEAFKYQGHVSQISWEIVFHQSFHLFYSVVFLVRGHFYENCCHAPFFLVAVQHFYVVSTVVFVTTHN